MSVGVGHSDSGASGIVGVATITNCSTAVAPLEVTVSVPGSGTVPAKFSAPFQVGGSLTIGDDPTREHSAPAPLRTDLQRRGDAHADRSHPQRDLDHYHAGHDAPGAGQLTPARPRCGARRPSRDGLVVEVLGDLVGARPLLGRDDEIDVTTAEAIRRSVCDAAGVDA